VDGGLSVDADGHFLPDTDALSLFNYFLAASGEEPQARIRQRIVAHIHSLLEQPAASEAVALLDTYLDFRDAMRELAEAEKVPQDLERRWQWIRELRRQYFGSATSEALFGQEEDVVRIDLERRRVATDQSLSAEERAEELEALDAQLPASVLESRQRARAPMLARDEVKDLRAAGRSEEEVFAVRERYFGREAAERLAALDEERREWDARLESYRSERDALVLEMEGEEPEDQHAAIEDLRRQHFSELEALRVRALDEM
jgi:lipase chaperone LimK